MKLKGFDKFREKLPDYQGKKLAIIPLLVIVFVSFTYFILFLFYTLPILLNSIISIIFPIIGVILLETIALLLVYQMWYLKDSLKKKYGTKSYQKIFFVGFSGIIMMISLAFNNLLIINHLNESFWSTTPFSIFAQSLFYLLSIPYGSFDFIRIIIGICVIIIGILAMFRSIFTFGFDYMTVIYLYFPEESEIQSHEIYSILRHPTYAALIYICIGSTLIEFSLYSFIFLGFYILGFLIHILLVEEKELIQRFGQSYVEYRKNVPAIFASIRKWPQFFKILFMSKN